MIDISDQESAALYAMDLLEGGRREEFERALRTQPDLRRLVRNFQQVTDALALDCPRQTAPAGAWDRIHLQVQWEQERERSQRELRRRTRWSMAGWAAAACLALAWGLPGFLPRLESIRSSTPAEAGIAAEFSSPPPSPEASEKAVGNKVAVPVAANDGVGVLQAQLESVRARETRWSQALAAALGQITNLATQLEARDTLPPGTRRVSWVAMAPPGQAHRADQALDTILSRLSSVLTNVVTTPPRPPDPLADTVPNDPPDGATPKLDRMRFVPRDFSRTNPQSPGESQPDDQTDKKAAFAGDSTAPTPDQSNEPVETIGVVVWDGRSPRMVLALSGVNTPPAGLDYVAWGPNSTALGTIHVPAGVNAGVIQLPAPLSGQANSFPQVMITVEPKGGLLSVPTGPVLILTP